MVFKKTPQFIVEIWPIIYHILVIVIQVSYWIIFTKKNHHFILQWTYMYYIYNKYFYGNRWFHLDRRHVLFFHNFYYTHPCLVIILTWCPPEHNSRFNPAESELSLQSTPIESEICWSWKKLANTETELCRSWKKMTSSEPIRTSRKWKKLIPAACEKLIIVLDIVLGDIFFHRVIIYHDRQEF